MNATSARGAIVDVRHRDHDERSPCLEERDGQHR